MSVYAEMERKGLLTSDIVNNQSSGIYGIMYNRINTWDESKQQYLLENTYAARHNFLMEHAAANTDWFDLLFTNSIMNATYIKCIKWFTKVEILHFIRLFERSGMDCCRQSESNHNELPK